MKFIKPFLPVIAFIIFMLAGAVVSGYSQDASGVIVAMPIIMVYTLANIAKPTAVDNNGGTLKYFYLSNAVEITTHQPVMTYAAAGDEVRITATHVWDTNKAAAKIYITENTGDITDETIGNMDGRGKKWVFKAFHPGDSAVFGEAEHNWKSIDAILHVPRPNGKVIQLGTPGSECEILARWKSNTRGGDGAGWEIEATCYQNSLLLYEGAIDNTF